VASIIATMFGIAIIRGIFDEKYGMCSFWKRPWEMLLCIFSTIAFSFTGISSMSCIQTALSTHNYEIVITFLCGIVVILSLLSVLVSIIIFFITPFISSRYLT
jgi:hypothetical protein